MEEKFKALSEEGAEVRRQARPDQEDLRLVHRRGQAAERGLPEDLGLQGRDLDAGVVPALGRRLLRVRAEADQGGDNPPEDVKKLAKMACKANPDDCGVVEGQYKDAIFQFVTPVEDEAKRRWKDTLERAAQMGVTNEYVKKARENLSKYLPDEFPFVKDERIGLEYP